MGETSVFVEASFSFGLTFDSEDNLIFSNAGPNNVLHLWTFKTPII